MVNYVNGQDYVQNQSFQKNFPHNFQATATNFQEDLKNLMQQLLLNQQKAANEINTKVDNMYNDLNDKYEVIWTCKEVICSGCSNC